MKRSLILLALLAGCGTETRFEIGAAEVKKFEEASEKVGHPVKVTDLIIEEGDVGSFEARCEQGGTRTPRIAVNSKRWNRADDLRREIILFHELGHCVLNREHLDTRRRGGSPVSIMHSYAVSTTAYQKDRDYYIHELFGGK